MSASRLEAFFLEGAAGRLFCLLHRPPAGIRVRGAVVYFAPFAEEMNKSRRMAALQARALAESGWLVLQPDMLGCGDSEGDFSVATWEIWLADAISSSDWLAAQAGSVPVLFGLRAGCLLANAVAKARPQSRRLMLWHPVISGRQHLQQFLRLKVAGAMLDPGRKGGDGTRQLREQLQGGTFVEVAGYLLNPALALGLEAATLAAPDSCGALAWYEVSGAATPEITLASRQAIDRWVEAGWRVDAAAIAGPSFWQTQEIEEVPDLLAASSSWMAQVDA